MKGLVLLFCCFTFLIHSAVFAQSDTKKTDSIQLPSIQTDEYKKYIPNYSPLPPKTAAVQKYGDYVVNWATV